MKAKELLSVVLYSYKKKVLSKGFIIMHLAFIGIFLITMGIGIAIGFSIGSSGVTKDSIIVIIDDKDHQDLFKTMIKENPSFKKYDIKSKAFYDTAVDEVKNKDKQAIIEIIKEGSVPTYNIITNDYSNTNLINEIKVICYYSIKNYSYLRTILMKVSFIHTDYPRNLRSKCSNSR